MKVKDLIEKLKCYDPEMEVVSCHASGYDFEEWYSEDSDIVEVELILDRDGTFISSEYADAKLPRHKKLKLG